MPYEDFLQSISLKYSTESGGQATFVPNKKLPIYNWFYYKEGFSRDLVFSLAQRFKLSGGSVALDPFCGSGTTLLACKQLGISAIGLDVLPISLFAARVKTAVYDGQELKQQAKAFLKTKFHKIHYDYPPLLKKNFSKFALEDISVFRQAAMSIEEKRLRDFFMLALINTAMKCGYAWKDGGAIKTRKRHVPPMRVLLRRTIYNMIRDIEHFEMEGSAQVMVEKCDARRMKLEDSSVDAIITSPPYLNNIDYTKVYEIEQFILHEKEEPSVRSYIGQDGEIENLVLPELDLPPAAVAYFTDMNEVIKEMHRVLKPGGSASIVVGNAYVNGMIIDSDTILAYLASKTGFAVEDITVMNERYALENRTMKKGILRESIVILKK